MKVRVFFSLLVLSLCATYVLAQGTFGTIRGRVQDTTGGVIPGAAVTIFDEETGISRSQVTTDLGTFNFPNLRIGSYRIEVELTGFKKYVREGVQVSANSVSEAKVVLEVGQLNEVVTVATISAISPDSNVALIERRWNHTAGRLISIRTGAPMAPGSA